MKSKNKSRPRLSLVKVQIKHQQEPLKLFYNGIKSDETKTAYRKTLREFIFAIEEFEGTFEERSIQLVHFANKESEKLKQLLKDYAIHLKKRAMKSQDSDDYLKPSVVPNKFKGIKKFLKMNEIPIEWSNIESIFPEITDVKQTRGYTTEEIKQILDYCTDVTTEFMILAESSSGIRVGAWEDQVWGNIRPIYEIATGVYTHETNKVTKNSRIVCASMVIYNGTRSKYVCLISSEAWEKLQSVKKLWNKRKGREPKPEDPVILTRFKDNRHYSKNGIRNKINYVIQRSGVQKPLKKGERNHEVPLTHGMRKRWNKIMSECQINGDSQANLIRKERLFGHKVGTTKLDESYFFSEIEEAVPQYLRAMPDLMISEEYRMKRYVEEVQNENEKLRKTIHEKDEALIMVEELKDKIERFEKYGIQK